MTDTLPIACPLLGSTPGGQEGLGKAGQVQGPCWVLPLACGASEQNRTFHTGRPPQLLPKAGLQALSPAGCHSLPEGGLRFLKPTHSAPKRGRKALWGGPLSGPLPLSLGAS